MEADPQRDEVHLDMAEAAREGGDFEKAEAELRAFLAKHPEDLAARFQLGELHQQRGRFKHAAEIFKNVLEKDPRHAAAHRSLARSYRKLGEPEKAIEALEQAMAVEGSREEAAGLDSLRDTLDLYEDTVAEYAPAHRQEWDSNLRRLAATAAGPSPESEEERAEAEEISPAETRRLAEDEVPIIQIGGQEPVLSIREEEERLVLSEQEEPPPGPSVDLRDETPPSLMNLLEGQKLYEENPNWRDYQPPPLSGFAGGQESPGGFGGGGGAGRAGGPAGTARGAEAGGQPAIAGARARASTPSANPPSANPPGYSAPTYSAPALSQQDRELLAQSVREAVRSQEAMAGRIADELREVYRNLDLRPQIIPVPMPQVMVPQGPASLGRRRGDAGGAARSGNRRHPALRPGRGTARRAGGGHARAGLGRGLRRPGTAPRGSGERGGRGDQGGRRPTGRQGGCRRHAAGAQGLPGQGPREAFGGGYLDRRQSRREWRGSSRRGERGDSPRGGRRCAHSRPQRAPRRPPRPRERRARRRRRRRPKGRWPSWRSWASTCPSASPNGGKKMCSCAATPA